MQNLINIPIKLLDCTLRDGGYYNDWDFDLELVNKYLLAMSTLEVDFIEIGFRSLKNEGFKGACAFSSDSYLASLTIPNNLQNKIGVMVNGSELITSNPNHILEKLFPKLLFLGIPSWFIFRSPINKLFGDFSISLTKTAMSSG